ncbi:hypothetical protein [Microbacterium aurum]|uniref:hypothetical protein n=1 Tax=Microbacterium aurum TaxID=36805 RepID=UPI0028EEB7D1|nr:hypothetical protein [Microbacterium aurum]
MRPAVLHRIVAAAIALVVIAAGVVVWRGMMRVEPLSVAEPRRADLRSLANTSVFFGHQSVGANVLHGLAALDGSAEAGIRIVESTDARDVAVGTVVHAHMGVNGDPQSKIDAFLEVMDAGMADAVDVALLKFCYVDVTAETDVAAVFAAYTAAIADLQARHPDTTFLYATVPLATARDLKGTIRSWLGRDAGMGPEDNVARQQFNAAVRDRLAGTDLLFDIAAVESGMDQGVSPRSHAGADYYVLDDSFAADPGHLGEAGSRAAAAELVRTIGAVRERA